MYIYILASKPYGTLYTGVTNDIVRRVYEHKSKLVPGFTSRYAVDQLVYYEQLDDPERAILREKQIKNWTRAKKVKVIRDFNPEWVDLYPGLLG
jgi:putative endonuclease